MRPQPGMVVGTGAKGIQVSEDVARLIELRTAGMTLEAAAEVVGIPAHTAQSWIRKYIRHVSSRAVIGFRNQELDKLEALWQKAMRIAEMQHWQFYQGARVLMPDPSGAQEVDPRTGLMGPVMVPVLDTDPNVRAILALIKISERKSRLMGGDRPPEKEIAPAGGDEDAKGPEVLTQGQFLEAMKRLETKLNVTLNRGAQDAVIVSLPAPGVDPLVAEIGE